MDVWTITILFKTSRGQVNLHYRDEKRARETYERVGRLNAAASHEATDDAGSHAVVVCAEVTAVVLTHVNEQHNISRDLQLLQAHAQKKLEQAARADPVLSRGIVRPEAMVPGVIRPQ